MLAATHTVGHIADPQCKPLQGVCLRLPFFKHLKVCSGSSALHSQFAELRSAFIVHEQLKIHHACLP